MIRLRYPVGLGIAAALLVMFSIVLSTSAAETIETANEVLTDPPAGQPSREDFVIYSMAYNLQYLLVQLVPWVVLAAALTGIGTLMLVALRSRQVRGILSGEPLEPGRGA